MADTQGLRRIGMAYTAFTAIVALIGVFVVGNHLSGRLTLDSAPTDISSSLAR